MKEERWVICSPNGIVWIGRAESENDAWTQSLRRRHWGAIENFKAEGWYAAKATVTWEKP